MGSITVNPDNLLANHNLTGPEGRSAGAVTLETDAFVMPRSAVVPVALSNRLQTTA